MRLFAVLFVGLTAATIYLISPFIAVWTLREAVRTGDIALLQRKVAWDSVRASLKQSLKTEAQLVPAMAEAGMGAPKPGLWKRIKNKIGAGMVDRFVDNTTTPAGLVQAYATRMSDARAANAPGAVAEEHDLSRVMSLISRIRAVDYPGTGQFVITVADIETPARRYTGHFVLDNLEWRLVGLAIGSAPGDGTAPSSLVTSVR